MAARVILDDSDIPGPGHYFAHRSNSIEFIPSGAAVLDCTLGGGWPLSRISNIIGDECLSGDTIVSAKRGTRAKKMTMQTLFNRVRGNHPNSRDVDTYLVADVGGHVGLARMLAVVHSGEKPLYEVTTATGAKIKASENHKFSTEEGWLCLCDGLRVGTAVKQWNGQGAKTYEKKERSYTYSIPYHPFGQRNFVAGRDYKRLLTARLVIEAAINGMSFREFIDVLRNEPAIAMTLQYTDPELEVHHLDKDPTNDRLDNLELISPEEHWETHADEMPGDTKRIGLSRIVSIDSVGRGPTFDITMEAPHHNFVANSFVVHNSTGKTLMAIEACANFARKYPKGNIYYRESESAFDEPYAQALGMPIDRVQFIDPDEFVTVEDFYEDLCKAVTETVKRNTAALYIVDSLDALSDKAEQNTAFDAGSYNTNKAKQIGKLLRMCKGEVSKARMCLIIISQTRDRITEGFMAKFAKKKTRSGGRALDFYASQCLWLSHLNTLTAQHAKIKRPVGIRIRAKCEKNKISLPLRTCEFTIRFGHGIDSLASGLDWLEDVDRWKAVVDVTRPSYQRRIDGMSDLEYWAEVRRVEQEVTKHWEEVEELFLSGTRQKYRDANAYA
jgi:RecA/RadA recombinase